MKHNKLFSIALSVILTILVAMPAIAQNQVKGTVLDENNEPVIGASVIDRKSVV